MNQQDFLLKTVMLIVAIAVIISVWFGFRTIDQQAVQIRELKEDTERQKNQISFLKNDNQIKTQVYQESENKRIEESVHVFVQSVFNVQESNFKERRSNAESVVTQELFERIFPSDEKPEHLLYEHEFSNVRVYTRFEGKNASAYVLFDQTVENLANDEANKTRLTIEVFLHKEGESWMVNDFQQINAEPL
jgi:hypothetical protein